MSRAWRCRAALGASVVVIVFASASVALAVKPKGGVWTGTTSQTLPITSPALTFQVASGGGSILNFEPVFQGNCTKPGSPAKQSPVITTDAGRNIPVKKSKFYAQAKNATLHSGTTRIGTAKDQVHGKFSSKKKASGTYSVTFTFNAHAPDGFAGYSCKTGVVSWKASAS